MYGGWSRPFRCTHCSRSTTCRCTTRPQTSRTNCKHNVNSEYCQPMMSSSRAGTLALPNPAGTHRTSPALLRQVLVSEPVAMELSAAGAPAIVREWITEASAWVDVRPVPSDAVWRFGPRQSQSRERAAIALAEPYSLDLLLIMKPPVSAEAKRRQLLDDVSKRFGALFAHAVVPRDDGDQRGPSPSSSAVARWTASSVGIGSSGNGRRTRSSTARSTSRIKQRRANIRRARTAACSSSAMRRPVARARMMARPACASVRADVTCCAPRGIFFSLRCRAQAARRPERSTACTALSSGRPWGRSDGPQPSCGRNGAVEHYASPRSASISCCGRTRRQADIGPVLERVATLHRRMKNTAGNELVPSTSRTTARRRSRGTSSATTRP